MEVEVRFLDMDILKLGKEELFESIYDAFSLTDVERIQALALLQTRANDLGIGKIVSNMIRDLKVVEKKDDIAIKRASFKAQNSIGITLDRKGDPDITINNFLSVMLNDEQYDNIKYNLLSNKPEIHKNGEIIPWTDTDDAASRAYIEKKYHIYHESKHRDALRMLFKQREYHPIQDIVDALVWDGVPRIESFLSKWAKAEDSEYTREISRLIFAGGIWRLYRPGCKFDDVPVLIGTAQGEGKSTLVRWLAMHDSYYAEITAFEGKPAIEQLDGVWIGEIAELLALTKTKEQEAVKQYISRQRDRDRRPYMERIDDLPRRCIFIGTTNNEQFLKDKTGNRRFYPVTVHSSGYWLYEHEQECRNYIEQCWAEAKSRYDNGIMPNYANQALSEEYKLAQEMAMEDDWRVGAIGSFLEKKFCGDRVCVRQIAHEALSPNPDFPRDPSRKDAIEIAQIMKTNFPEWVRGEKVGRVNDKYGAQRYWEKQPVPEASGEIL